MPAVFQEFIREGCLRKLTKKGLQQRMFLLVGGPGSGAGRGCRNTPGLATCPVLASVG